MSSTMLVVGCGDGSVRVVSHIETAPAVTACLATGARPMVVTPVPQHPRRLLTIRNSSADGTPQGTLLLLSVSADGSQITLESEAAMPSTKDPCHISTDPSGKVVFAACYSSGHVTSWGLDPSSAAPTSQISIHQHGDGTYTDKGRQDGAHPHHITLDRSGNFAYVCDLGLNAVVAYSHDGHGKLTPIPEGDFQIWPGAGPRHLVTHPTLPVVYIVNELDNTVAIAQQDTATGRLTQAQKLQAVPEDYTAPPPFPFYTANTHAAEVDIDPSAQWLVVSNRGHDSLAFFQLDPATGRATLAHHLFTHGALPWQFKFVSPTLLAVTTQFAKDLKSEGFLELYDFTAANGQARRLHTLAMPQPMWVEQL